MAEPKAKGSIVFKLIILILIAVVLAAIIVPQKEWARQAAEQELCRKHLENVYFTSLQYLKKHKSYITDLDSLINFIEQDSMMVPPGLFEVERLTVWGSPRDSFLVGFPDDYHFKRINWEYSAPETLYLKLVPKERYSQIPESKMVFTSSDSIFVERREKAVGDEWIRVWGKSLMDYQRVEVDSVKIPIKNYAISEDPEDFRVCPTCKEPYELELNVNLKIKGIIEYTILRKEGGNVRDDEFLSNLFIKKLRSDAAMEALSKFKADTTIFVKKQEEATRIILGEIPDDTVRISLEDSTAIVELRDSLITAMKDSMVVKNFIAAFAKLRPGAKVTLEEEATKMVVVDSIQTWEDSNRIKNTLFNEKLNEEELQLSSMVDLDAMLGRLQAEEKYFIARIDSVGLTISCPIDSVYYDPDRSFLMKIFGVGPASNHGRIKNNDYSWSEKK